MAPQPNKNPESAAVLGGNFPTEDPDEFNKKAEEHEEQAEKLDKLAEDVKKDKEKLGDAAEGKTAEASEEELDKQEKELLESANSSRELALKMRTYADNLNIASANMNVIDDKYHADFQALMNQSLAENWTQDQLAAAKQQLLMEAQGNVSAQAGGLAAVQDGILAKAVSGQPLDMNDVLGALPAAAGVLGSMLTGFASTAMGGGGMPSASGYGTPFMPPGAGGGYGYGSPTGFGMGMPGATGMGSPMGGMPGYGMPGTGAPMGGAPSAPQPGGIIGQLGKALGDFGGAIYGAATGLNPSPGSAGTGTPNPLGAYPANNQFAATPGTTTSPITPGVTPAGEALKNLSDKAVNTPIVAKGSLSNHGAEGSFRVGDTSGNIKIGDGEISGSIDHTPGQEPPSHGGDEEVPAPATAPSSDSATPAPEPTPEPAPAPESAPPADSPADAPAPESTPSADAPPAEAPETDPATSSGENETLLSSDRGDNSQTRLSSAGAATGHVQTGAAPMSGAPMMGAPMMGGMGMGGMGAGGGSASSGSRGKVISSSDPLGTDRSSNPVTPDEAPRIPTVKANTTGATKQETNWNLRTPGNADSMMVPAGARGSSHLTGLSPLIAGAHTRAAALTLNWAEAGYDRLSGAIGVFKAGTTIRYIMATTYGVSYVPLGTKLPGGLWLLEQFGTTADPLASAESKLRAISDTQVGTLETIVKFGDGFTVDTARAHSYKNDDAVTASTGKRLPAGYMSNTGADPAGISGLAANYLKSLKSTPSTMSALIMMTTAEDKEDLVRRYREFIGAEIKASEESHQSFDTEYELNNVIEA